MKRFFVVPLLVAIAFAGPIPPDLPEAQKNIKRSVETRNYAAAIDELQKLKASDEKAFTDGDYDYLLGRMAEANGDLAIAMSSYHAVANRDSALNAYALKHLSQIARSTGNLILERLYLSEILVFSPNSLIANSAMLRLARNSFERGNYSETIRIITSETPHGSQSNKPADNANLRETQALLAEAFLLSGQTDRARETFINLINTVPNAAQPDDVALAAAKNLDRLDVGSENLGKKVAGLPESEHQRRANIYQFNRDFVEAKLHFEAVIGHGNPTNSADAVFQIGRGYAQRGDFVEALKWFERVLERYPKSPAAKDALLNAASAYGRVGKPAEATTRYQKFIEEFPSDEKLDRAYLNIVDILRDHGSDTDALKWCVKVREVFKGKLPEAIAFFTEARIHMARAEWQNALNALERLTPLHDLGGSTVPGGTSVEEIAFLKGLVYEQLAKYPEAIETYLSIPDGRAEYYGWRATERLRLLANSESARSHIAQTLGSLSAGLKGKDADATRRNASMILRLTDTAEVRDNAISTLRAAIKALPNYSEARVFKPRALNERSPISNDQNRTVAYKLIVLGLYDEAAPEIESATSDISKLPPDNAYELATHFRNGNRADWAMAYFEPLWRKIPADYPIELMDRDQLELLYPAPFADELLRHASVRGVDPRLLLAIMRQESRFQPDAKSYAAARGLMQFIATTSIRIAGEVGRNNFQQDDLYYPPTAILLGSQYLADLFKIFPDQPDAVVASYNGGDDNMKRWLARSRSNEPDRFVPEIVYSQSKDYVHRVMASYRMYKFLYDGQLRPAGSR